MHRRILALLAALAMLGAACNGGGGAPPETTAAAGGQQFAVQLSGAEEAPNPGDEDGTGSATITLDAEAGEVCFELTVEGIEPASAAHIHQAAAGTAGPVVVPLEPAPAEGSSNGCVSADPAVIAEIAGDPAGFYVNVHNAEFPDGAVRGQLG
ncbi:MAG: CHRD domain-containing protein [Acidimicrobiia bacterium]